MRSSCHAVSWLALFILVGSVTADDRPNIVVILADDLGYGDVEPLNADSAIPTPHFTRLAQEGMTFVDAHTPSSVCTPTRYGLLAGRYCWRTRLTSGVLNGYGEPLIDDETITMPEHLVDCGYATGIVGKWHLGLGFARDGEQFDFSRTVSNHPGQHGFFDSFVIPASLDFPPYVFVENGELTQFPELTQEALRFPRFVREGERSADFDFENCLDDLVTQASGYIEDHADGDKPFFLYFPLTAPHKPVWPHSRFAGQSALGPYGDFVMQVDATVGAVLQALDDAGIADSTLVIVTSDNGSFNFRLDDSSVPDHVDDESIQAYRADRHRSNGPWRGTKADIWEGGHRVPFFVRWPGHVEPGSQCDETICLTDIFATLGAIIGEPLPYGAGPDSFDFSGLLRGEELATPRAPVIHHSVAGMFAIRQGPWKLVLGNGSGGREQPRGMPFERPYALFNLDEDPAEAQNVIDRYPDLAARLEVHCLQIRESGSSFME